MASCGYAATNALLYSDDFEGYTNGTPLIDGTNNWYSSSWTDTGNVMFAATVLSNVTLAAADSTNVAMIPFDVTLSNRFWDQTLTNVWIRLQQKIVRYPGPTNVVYDTNTTVAFYFDSDGYCVVCDGTNGWVTVPQALSGQTVSVDANSFATFDVFLNYTNKTWKININSIELTNNIGFINTNATNYDGFYIYNSGLDTTTYLDNVSVYDANSLPALSVSPSSLTNTANATNISIASQSFNVISRGDGQLSYYIITNSITPGWEIILTNNATGTLTNNATNTVWVKYNTASLSPGVYSNSFNVISTNWWGRQTQTVRIVVDVYSMSIAPTSLINTVLRGFNATNQPFNVRAGGGDMSFTASTDVAWLNVIPTSKYTSGGATETLTNTYTTTNLSPGDYGGTVTVVSADGGGSTGVVSVALRVLSTPVFNASPAHIMQVVDKGANPTGESFQVWNSSDAPFVSMDYQVAVSIDVSNIVQGVSPSSGTTSSNQHKTVGVYFNNNLFGFNSGTYTAIVAIVATNSGTSYAGQWSATNNVEVVLVIAAPAAPALVNATKGDYEDRVAVNWRPVVSHLGGPVTYNVLRHTTFDPDYAHIIVSGLTVTNYADTTVSPGVRNFYWVQSVNSYGQTGTNSSYDSGYRRLAAPSGLFASDGAYTNKVAVSWASVDGATTYYVYRYNGVSTKNVYYTSDTKYDDITAVEGLEYTYYIEATNSICGSLRSAGETGYVLSRPIVLSASDGQYVGQVVLTWNAVSGATSYEIWKSTQTLTPPSGGGVKIGETASVSYNDAAVMVGTKYYYWLKSKNATALSGFSDRDEGYTATAAVDLSLWGLVVQPRRIGLSGNPRVVSFRLANNGGAALTGDNGTVQLSFYASANDVFGDGDDKIIGTVNEQLTLGIGSSGIFGVDGANVALPAAAGSYNLFMRLNPIWPSTLAPTSLGGWVTQRAQALEVSTVGPINYQAMNDYNGDGASDLMVHGSRLWDGSSVDGFEFLRNAAFGGNGVAVMGDYDGDCWTDPVVYDESSGFWQVLFSGSGYADVSGWFGGSGYRAVPGDYDGDGKINFAVYDTVHSLWYALDVVGGWVMPGLQFGNIGYEPVMGDYDGDGVWDLALYNESNGLWYIRTVSGTLILSGGFWGGPSFLPVPGDYDGDGLWDFAVYNEATCCWYIVNIWGEIIIDGIVWGAAGYRPVSGDFDGDGLSDMAVYNSKSGKWLIRPVSGTWFAIDVPWGGAGHKAVGGVE